MKLIGIQILVAFIFATHHLAAQNSIKGLVVNENKQPIEGVEVYLTDLKISAYTDQMGNFSFSNLKTGSYLLELNQFGYSTVVSNFSLTKDTFLRFVLTEKISEVGEIIVTGVSRSTELKLNPVIVKTVDGNSLLQNASSNIIDGLKNTPGVSQITTGAAISKPIIRGLGYNRVINLNNGIRQEGQQWGDEHGIEMDQYTIDRVEIVKGPGSLMYGSDGIAGVLNFLGPKALPDGQVKTQMISNFQSNQNLIANSLSNSGNLKGLQWRGRITNKLAGNYQNAYDGKVLNSGFKEHDGNLFVGINKNWGHSHLTLSSFNQTLNLPEGERDSLGNFTYVNANGDDVTASPINYSGYKIGFPHQQITHLRLSLSNYFILKKGTINADFGFQNNKRKEFGDPTHPSEMALFFDLNTINYNLRYNVSKINGWETSFGLSGMQQSNTNKGLEFLIPNYQLFDAGAFVLTQKTIKKLTIAGGLRFDNRWLHADALYLDSLEQPVLNPGPDAEPKFISFTKNYNGFSGSIGTSYKLNKHNSIKVNVSQGFRAPNIAELASNGRHEGTFKYEVGTMNLKPELSRQFDLAYFLNAEHLTFELTPFLNTISNYIYTEKMQSVNGGDSIPDPNDPAPAFKFSSGNARLLGGEVYFDVHPHPLDWLHIENSFSYVQAVQLNQPDSSKYLPFIPAPKYRGEIKAQFPKLGRRISNAYAQIGVDHYFAQQKIFSANGTETATPQYTLLSAGIGLNIKAFERKNFITLYLSGENLGNVAYQSHLSRLKYAPENTLTGRYGIYNMGRNISLMVLLNF